MKPLSSLSVFLVVAVTLFAATQALATVYVDKSAVGANNGTSWQNAYTTLQPAIDKAFLAGGDDVWVAGGPLGSPVVYNEPRTEGWGGPTLQQGSLVMKDNVGLYGGFEGWRGGAGAQETIFAQRQPGVNITVISGATSRAGSPAYHVVVFGKGSAATVNAQIDGFHITGGNASGVVGEYHTYRGGGIYNWRSAPVIAQCYIYGNTASVSGGGVANEGITGAPANASYVNCVIADNTASRNIDWQNNPARGGGGVFINQSSPSLWHVTIANNITGAGGTAPGNPVNYGLNSGGIYNVTVGALPVVGGTVLSGIIWANTGTSGIINERIGGGVAVVMTATFSDIAGGYAGAGNINANPNFVGAFPWAYQINGAPCVDTGSSSIIIDIRTVPRPIGAGRDMGAYEYSPNAPVAVCAPHTVNLDATCAATMTAANINGGNSAEAGIWKIVAGQTTFGSADIPSKSVVLTVYDKIGRTATCNATVTVNDPINPVITFCPPSQNVSANASCLGTIPNLAALVTATDNCGIASINQLPLAGTLVPLGPALVTMTVTDVGGNAVSTCSATVTVVDDTLPVITVCPPSVNLVPDPSCNVTVPNFIPSGAYADNCGIASVTQNPPAGTIVQGTTTVTITVTDTSSNVNTCQTSVIVSDSTNPVAVCQNITVNLSAPTINGQAIDGGSTDNCGISTWLIDGNATKTFTCADIPSTVVTLTVQDAAGNSATCNATVTVVDNVAPTAVCQNITVNLSAPTIGAAAVDGGSSDNCGITSVLIDGNANKTFTCADLGPNTVTLYVADAAGLSDTCDATVTVVDNIDPDAVCQNITVSLSSPTRAAAAIDGGSTDNCGITQRLISGGANRTFTCADMPSTSATLEVRDAAGNSDTCPATVTVLDDIKPIITRTGAAVITVECSQGYTDLGASANDNCDGVITGSIVTVDPVDPDVVGTYIVTYNVKDAANNDAIEVTRTVNVVDTTVPIITLGGSATVTVECKDAYTDDGATADDDCDGNISGDIVTVNPVDTSIVDTYTVTYNVKDAENNNAVEVTRTVNVVDTTIPVITMNDVTPVTVECGTSYTDDGATADDVCDGALTPNVASTVNVNLVGSYTVTYTVSDGNGNDAVPVVRDVEVVDTTIPEITRLGDAIVYVQLGNPYTDAGATADDQCDGDITDDIVTVNPVDVDVPAVYEVTYNVTDGEGLDAVEVTRMVIVSDTSQPDVVSVTVEDELNVLVRFNKDMEDPGGVMDPANYTVAGSGIGTLNVSPDSVERVSPVIYRLSWVRPDEMFNGGDIEITVNPDVEDPAGNFMRYNVGEDSGGAIGEAPVITLNGSDETLECGVDTFLEAGATAEDNVDGDVAVDITGDELVDVAVVDVYVISYTAVDAAGNESVVTRDVTVEDTTVPEILLFGGAALELECNLENYEEYGASAWDACAGDITGDIIKGAPANTAVLGLQIVTYEVTDAEGNTANAEREVTVVDTTAPVIALFGDDPVVLTDGGDYVEAGAEAWDDCEGDLTGDIEITGEVGDVNTASIFVLNYSVSDSSDNTAGTTRTVVVKPVGCEILVGLTVTPNPAVPGVLVTMEVAEDAGSCSAGTLNYTWQKAPLGKADFTVIPGAPNDPVYEISSVTFEDAGIYKCTVSDASDSADTNEVTLVVGTGVPAVGLAGLALAAAAAALAGVATLRKRR